MRTLAKLLRQAEGVLQLFLPPSTHTRSIHSINPVMHGNRAHTVRPTLYFPPFAAHNRPSCRRHDNDAERISEISVRPTAGEILSTRPSYLPANDLSKCTGMNHLKVWIFPLFFRAIERPKTCRCQGVSLLQEKNLDVA